jgi:hypothetical protein
MPKPYLDRNAKESLNLKNINQRLMDWAGRILKQVRCDCTPMTAENFLTLCKRGYYNGTIFHRLVCMLRKSRIACPFCLSFRS